MALCRGRALRLLHRLVSGGRAAPHPHPHRAADRGRGSRAGFCFHNRLYRGLQTSVHLRMVSEEHPHNSQTDTERQDPNSSYSDQSAEKGEGFESEDQLRQQLLSSALKFVPRYGWSVEAIAEGAKVLELSPAVTGMFSHGPGDLVLHFVTQCNRQLSQALAEQHRLVELGQEEAKTTDVFIKDAVEARLRMVIPYVDSWPQAMSLLLMPENVADSLRSLTEMVDEIWFYAGDKSTDSNWYTKRAVLAGIYNATELVLVQDSSPDYENTWTFLQHRVNDVVGMARSAKQAQLTGKAVLQGLMGAAVTVKNLTGIGPRR
ncbi:ubiquinone biosynthesis protein COQ9, mitochondrial isoform X2 [Pristis pectinata]|uniref:ubiquinone biosynthesis protein COQ9, mitochondrial isoform X2 n=1 Tax=Pristis pectinata TaxID=685728 RepID=UPI00223CD121|nr:ubiquinone biosynthesis protein COQ9, mitochondrial isoform X2 [Pristis pectinata]